MPVVPLIRHAEGSFGSAVYDVLSECGHAQVDALRRALERCGVVPDHVVSGSLRRQRDTARPWAATITDAGTSTTTVGFRSTSRTSSHAGTTRDH